MNHLIYVTYLFTRFEDITLKCVTASIASNVTKDFQIVAVMGDVEYPVTIKQNSIYTKQLKKK